MNKEQKQDFNRAMIVLGVVKIISLFILGIYLYTGMVKL